MVTKLGWVLGLAALGAGAASAADLGPYPGGPYGVDPYADGPSRFITARRNRPVGFGPDCHVEAGGLLGCLPRIYVDEDAPGVEQGLDGPPRVTRRPYPEPFSW